MINWKSCLWVVLATGNSILNNHHSNSMIIFLQFCTWYTDGYQIKGKVTTTCKVLGHQNVSEQPQCSSFYLFSRMKCGISALFARKLFSHSVFWWWCWRALSNTLSTGFRADDGEGHSVWFTSFSYSSNHLVTPRHGSIRKCSAFPLIYSGFSFNCATCLHLYTDDVAKSASDSLFL